MWRAHIAFFAGAVLVLAAAPAAVLEVGPGAAYATIADAGAAAQDGDTIEIASGSYGCAEFTASNLTIRGVGAAPLVSGPVCHTRALFWFGPNANNITVSNIAFSGAVDANGNGAGILFNGVNLAVNGSSFTANQDGLLIADHLTSTVTVDGSTFSGNGACLKGMGCAHGIYANRIGSLVVTNSSFDNTKTGHDIKSRAKNTEITNSTITDGPYGTASYLIDIPDGGNVTISGNTMEKGLHATNHTAAISIGEESAKNATGQILIASNLFRNDMTFSTAFVWNHTATPAVLSGNSLSGHNSVMLKGKGSVSAAAALRIAEIPEPGTLAVFVSALALGRRRKSIRPSGCC